MANDAKLISDFDFLLFGLCFGSYISVKFVSECSLITASVLILLFVEGLRRTTRVRQKMYLYFVILFTTREDQLWLQNKISISLNSVKSSIKRTRVSDQSFTDVLNKVRDRVDSSVSHSRDG